MDDSFVVAVAILLFCGFVGFVIGVYFGAWMEQPRRDDRGRFCK